MQISQFSTVMRARKKLMAKVFFSILVLVIIISLVFPDHYKGISTVVVDVKPDPVSGMVPMLQDPTIIATQLDILNSDRVARRVVKDLKLDQDPTVRAQWQDDTDGKGNVVDWLALFLQKHMDAKPSRESNVIEIDYTAPDPNFAAGVSNAFVQAYLETLQELRVDPARQNTSFFDQRVKEARADIQKAQAKMSDYQRTSGITASDERVDVETGRLNDLANQLVLMEGVAQESTSRHGQAQGGNGDKMTEALNNPVIANLKFEIDRDEANLQTLTSHLGDANPQVIQARANIADLRSKLDAETRRVTSGVGINANIDQSRLAQLRTQMDEQRAKVLKLKEGRDAITMLSQEVADAQKNYDNVVLRQSQTSLESQSQQGQVSVLSTANPPAKPAYPILILNILIGIFLGGIAAVVTALHRENTDRLVRTPQDLADLLGLPVLGIIPRPIGERKKRPLSLMAQRVISGRLPAPAKK